MRNNLQQKNVTEFKGVKSQPATLDLIPASGNPKPGNNTPGRLQLPEFSGKHGHWQYWLGVLRLVVEDNDVSMVCVNLISWRAIAFLTNKQKKANNKSAPGGQCLTV